MRATGLGRAVGVERVSGADRRVGARLSDPPDMSELHNYQADGVRWLRKQKRALLADEMGCGKSVQVLRALSRYDRAIVLAPASVLRVWVSEAQRWRPNMRVRLGREMRRPAEGEMLVYSYDSLPEPPARSRLLVAESMRGTTLVLDECHMVKHWRAQRTMRTRRLAAQCDRVWGLSGTPMLGTPPDLWGVLSSLRLQGIFEGYDEFVSLCGGKARYMRDRRTGQIRQIGHTWSEVSEEVRERLDRVMLRRLRKDVLASLPPKQYVDVPVEAPEDLRSYLDAVKEKWDGVDPGDLPPFELLSEARAALARARIPAALEYVRNAADSVPLLVFSAHVDPIVELGTKLAGAAYFTGQTPPKTRAGLVRMFQEGKLRILCMTIDAGGVGLTLTAAGGVVFVDRDYTPALNAQAEDRAVRPGQEHQSVLVARLMSDHPLDVRMNEILDEKQRLVSAAVG